MSKASGSDVVVVTLGDKLPKKKKRKNNKKNRKTPKISPTEAATQRLTMDYQGESLPVMVFTLQAGEAPQTSVNGSDIIVGGQVFL